MAEPNKKFVNSEHSSAVCQNSGQNKYYNQDFRKQTSFCNYVYLFIVLLPPNFLEILLLRMIKLMFYVYLIQICFFLWFCPRVRFVCIITIIPHDAAALENCTRWDYYYCVHRSFKVNFISCVRIMFHIQETTI